MVVALMGTLKAGGCYMPLDPDYPSNRLALMLEDAQPPVILTQKALLPRLPAHEVPAICLDSDWARIASEPDTNLGVQSTRNDAVYVIYTSGSTGKPKGVINILEAIVNHLQWKQDAYRLTAADRVLQKTPYGFDISVWEFFWPLVTGASLVMARPVHRDPEYLAQLIAQENHDAAFRAVHAALFLESAKLPKRSTSARCSAAARNLARICSMFFAASDAELQSLRPDGAAVDVTYWVPAHDQRRLFPLVGLSRIPDLYPDHIWPGTHRCLGRYVLVGLGWSRLSEPPELTAERFIPTSSANAVAGVCTRLAIFAVPAYWRDPVSRRMIIR
jgi:non-ribosomal peptide synthetase component F